MLARVDVEMEDGRRATGFASDLLIPKWFDKDPRKSARRNIEDLMASARQAGAAMRRVGDALLEPFALWWTTYGLRSGGRDPEPTVGLVAGFGVALFERAMIDGLCRAAGVSFHTALREGHLGFAPGTVHRELRGWHLADGLPTHPARSIRLRHTVGLGDPLRSEGDEGGAASLTSDIRRTGATFFKIKVGGDPPRDLARLLTVAEVVAAEVDGDARFTLDGNEQYDDLGVLAKVLEGLAVRPAGRALLEGLLYIEQPLPRSRTFDPLVTDGLSAIRDIAPVIIDEADYGVDAFPRALDLGYRGVSAKCCKGVFRTLLNRGLCEVRGDGAFQTAEDLTCLPVVALQQDLAVAASLGFTHCERNGHHYFAGLQHLPVDEANDALAAHPDLYRRGADGVELRIENGRLELESLACAGFGYNVTIRAGERLSADLWQYVEA